MTIEGDPDCSRTSPGYRAPPSAGPRSPVVRTRDRPGSLRGEREPARRRIGAVPGRSSRSWASRALGLTSFGGPIAHIGYFRREYVDRDAAGSTRPRSPTSSRCASSCPDRPAASSGSRSARVGPGMLGGLAAWLGFTLPSAIALTALGVLAASADLADAGWVHGLKLAAVAVVAQAVWVMAGSARRRTGRAGPSRSRRPPWRSPGRRRSRRSRSSRAGASVGRLLLAPPLATRPGAEPSPVSRRVGIVCLAAVRGAAARAAAAARDRAASRSRCSTASIASGALVFGGGHVVLPLLQSDRRRARAG